MALWNRGTPDAGVARPLTVHEFDAHVIGGPLFEAEGLVVAVRDGRPVGFVHAGFGPEADELGPRPLRLGYDLGTITMLVVDPGCEEPGLESELLAAAERYLRGRGAKVIYAGGRLPLNPFYWGVYGGSENAGILGAHGPFLRAVARSGYEPVGDTVLLEIDLTGPEPRDPRGVLARRQTRLEVDEDAMPSSWWQALAVGGFRPTRYALSSKPGETRLAHATTWDMTWFGRRDGRARVGLIDLEVHPDHRRKGYGRHLVSEVLRHARSQATATVAVQTETTNAPALKLYQSLGFEPIESSTLFRLPAGRS